jgi:cyanophycinase
MSLPGAFPTLIAIGGALDPQQPIILQEFCRRAGAEQAQIVVLPTASSNPETGAYYTQLFLQLGVRSAQALEIHSRAQALQADAAALQQASGIFLTGGNQARLSALLGGTPLEVALLQVYQRGAVVAGTSAGAAALSTVMLAFGKNGPTPRQRSAQFSAGLGLCNEIIFDQHFRQRDRLGRLLYAVACHPGKLGVGLDENTAAILEAHPSGSRLEVYGQNAVTIIDGSHILASDVAELTGAAPVAISGAWVHVLTHGCSFDLSTRQATILVKTLQVE